MPFKRSKRDTNKQYYASNADAIKEAAKAHYNINRDAVIRRSTLNNTDLINVNAPRVRKAAAQRMVKLCYKDIHKARHLTRRHMADHRLRDPAKARVSTQKHVDNHRLRDPDKTRASSQRHVADHRLRDPAKARVSTQRHVADHRLRDPAKIRVSTQRHVADHRLRDPAKARVSTQRHVADHRLRDPAKARVSTQKHVADHRLRDPAKARVSTQRHVTDHRLRDPAKARLSTQRYVADHRLRDPAKARVSTQRHVADHRLRDPIKARCESRRTMVEHRRRQPLKVRMKSRAANRKWVSKHYYKNLLKSRAISRTSTARHYMQHLLSCRMKSKHKSRSWYKKHSTILRLRRREKYPLAEPNQQTVACLVTDLQDILQGNKSIVREIIAGVESLLDSKASTKLSKSFKYTLCKLAATHLVRLSLQVRRQTVATLLNVKKEVMELGCSDMKDFGPCSHAESREPYFYEAGYTHDHLPVISHLYGQPRVQEPLHPLSSPISVKPAGQCMMSDILMIPAKDQQPGEGADEDQKGGKKPTWGCTSRCRQLSDDDVATIICVTDIFMHDVAQLRKGLDECDACPYASLHAYKQEWEMKKLPKKHSLGEGNMSAHAEATNQLYSEHKNTTDHKVISEYVPVERKGHPLVCHLPGSECQSKLRILRNAAVHYPQLAHIQTLVSNARRAHNLIKDIDQAIKTKDYQLLLKCCKVTFQTLFKRKELKQQNGADESKELKTPLRVPYLEAKLLTAHFKVVEKFSKKIRDYALLTCVSCQQLFRRDQCTLVSFDDFDENNVWLQIQAHAFHTHPEVLEGPVYMCKHCKAKVAAGNMPARAAVNGLETTPLPSELRGLDPFSLQLIQLAKAFQTVVRLKTYSNKVPTYNSLKACKGNVFVLPLPLGKTVETLRLSETGLPKPELYIKVDGAPTKKKVIWQKLIDINKIVAALQKLKDINWLYSDVKPDKAEKSAEDIVLEIANSATSTMIEKVTNKEDYIAGLQAYTVRRLDKHIPTTADIDQYKMLNVDEYPLKSNQQYLDLMCFPDLFPEGRFGEHEERDVPLSFSEFVKSKLLNRDSRFRKKVEYIFYLMHLKLLREIKAGIYNCIKNTLQRGVSVQSLLNKVESNDSELEGNLSTILRSVRGTKQYWNSRRTELNSMVRDFGPPTLFLTFSCAEYNSADITEYLKLVNGYSPEDNVNIVQLCTEDPVSVSRQFSHKFHVLFHDVLLKGEVLGKVKQYFFKKEYQLRGAPHYHVLLWIQDAPVIGVDPDEVVLAWIQERITCHIPDPKTDPQLHYLVTRYQMHRCSSYCLRNRKFGFAYISRCKFNFPREVTTEAKINQIEPSLKKRQRVCNLPRKTSEARVNDYNPLLLYLWGANIDIQFIAESSLALTGYVTSYVTKAEISGLNDVWADIASSGSLFSRLMSFGTKCMKTREVGLYEAADLLLGDHLTEKSCQVLFVNARLPSKRTRLLKKFSELQELHSRNPHSEDLYAPSLIDVHYPQRPDTLSDMCLYEFARSVDWYHKDKSGRKTYRRLSKSRVISHPVFDASRVEQEQDYYYLLVLLFVPFTDESDLLLPGETSKQAFERNQSAGLLAHHERLQKMLEAASKRKEISEARQTDSDQALTKSSEDDDSGIQITGKAKTSHDEPFTLDHGLDNVDLDKRVSMLNTDQLRVYKSVTNHLLHQLKHEQKACSCDLQPLQMFISGVGGTGKSFLIQTIRAFVKATWPHLTNASAVAAPTGLAACNVNGITTYQLFKLPIEHESKTASYWALSKDNLKFLRVQLKNVKIFIIDEVSMVSSLNLTYIHLRLDEIFGGDQWFAGKTVLFVGDILQLPPVNGSPVFQGVHTKLLSLRVGCIGSVNIWRNAVVYDELTINERQKMDGAFSNILDSVRRGFPSDEAIHLLQGRVFQDSVLDMYNKLQDEGKSPLCLLPTRKACADINNQLLHTLGSEIVHFQCINVIDEAGSDTRWNKKAAEHLKTMNLDSNLTAGLAEVIHLAVGARVMLTRNLDTDAGLVNGAIGTVLEIASKYVNVKFDQIAEPFKVKKVTSRFCVLKKFYVHRDQYPLIVAYAVTIHKSQGLSLDCAIIDLSDQVFGAGMAYVALSRVRSLDGVYLRAFTPASIKASRACVEEVNRLRKTYRPDLPLYDLPAKGTKRKVTGFTVPPAKRCCTDESCATRQGQKRIATFDQPEPKKQKIDTNSKHDKQSEADDCFIVDDPEHPNSINPTEAFHFNPLGINAQKRACQILGVNYHGNAVCPGGPDVPLIAPDQSTLINTNGDGSCMFRALSIAITGSQHQHIKIRQSIVQYLCNHESMFMSRLWLFDIAYADMESYLQTRGMRQSGWGSQIELFAVAHMLHCHVFTFSEYNNAWLCYCPSKIDPAISPPQQEQGLYIYHTGDHYKVVKSLRQ